MAWYEVALWIAVAFAAIILVMALLLVVMGSSVVAMIFGDGDVSLYAAIAGLCATVFLFPFLLVPGIPLCYLWPAKGDAKRGDVFGRCVNRMFFWWTTGFREFNE